MLTFFSAAWTEMQPPRLAPMRNVGSPAKPGRSVCCRLWVKYSYESKDRSQQQHNKENGNDQSFAVMYD